MGVFICLATGMISFSVFTVSKGREIAAFGAQQQMPIAQEGIDKMSPSLGKAAGSIAKGIKDGLNDDEE